MVIIRRTRQRASGGPVRRRRGTPFRTFAEDVFRRHARRWKPGTLAVNRSYLRNQIMPWFCELPVADVTRGDVQRWFDSLHETPAAANRSNPILSVILRQAEIYGHRPADSNPCGGLRRYREEGRERFLTLDEVGRLGAALAAREAAAPLTVAAVRLLALTGCRQGEVRTLLWPDSRAAPVPARQQDRAAHGLAVVGRPPGARRSAADEPLDLSRRIRRGPLDDGRPVWLLAGAAPSGGPAGREVARPPAHVCELRPAAG